MPRFADRLPVAVDWDIVRKCKQVYGRRKPAGLYLRRVGNRWHSSRTLGGNLIHARAGRAGVEKTPYAFLKPNTIFWTHRRRLGDCRCDLRFPQVLVTDLLGRPLRVSGPDRGLRGVKVDQILGNEALLLGGHFVPVSALLRVGATEVPSTALYSLTIPFNLHQAISIRLLDALNCQEPKRALFWLRQGCVPLVRSAAVCKSDP